MLKLNLKPGLERLKPWRPGTRTAGSGPGRAAESGAAPRWKRIAMLCLGAVSVVVLGLFAWDSLLNPPPSPPAEPVMAKPAPIPAPNPSPPAAAAPSAEGAASSGPDRDEPPGRSGPVVAAVPAAPLQPAATPSPDAASSAARALTSRSRLDARECLNLETNLAVHRCAEKFR